MRIAIIGTGLSSWAVFESIKAHKSQEDSITIIDANYRYSTAKSVNSIKGMKNKFGSSFAYEVNESGFQFREQSNFSLAHGGLSNTWGAGIRLWSPEYLEFVPTENQKIYIAAKKLLDRIPFSGDEISLNIPSELKIVSTQPPCGSHAFDALFSDKKNPGTSLATRTGLAVNVQGPNACTGCGACLSGCPYGSIFESSSLFDEYLRKKEFNFVEGMVTDIQNGATGTRVSYKTRSHSIESLEFDKVYLCAGAIGTPAILMRSNLLPSQVSVADSQVFYFTGIGYFNRNKKDEYFALSQATISSNIGDDPEFMCSLYSCNSDVRKRISELISSRLFGLQIKLPKFLDRILFLGIGFIDSTQSGTIELELVQDANEIEVSSIRNPKSKRVVKGALRKIARTTRKSRMFTLTWFYQMPSPGAGFHSGASMPAGGNYVSGNGTLKTLESVVIADVSILPFIKPGPHTFTSMAINAAIVEENFP
jgi:ferredoxin